MNIDANELKPFLAEAILQYLDEDKRTVLIREALAHLVTEQTVSSGYGNKRRDSPLVQAFKDAAADMAAKVIAEELAKPELGFRDKIRAVVVEGFEKYMTSYRENVVTAVAERMASAFKSEY